MAKGKKTLSPFYSVESAQETHLERILPLAFVFVGYFFISVPLGAPGHNSLDLRGTVHGLQVFALRCQRGSKMSKHVRPVMMLSLAAVVIYFNFVMIQEMTIFGLLGKAAGVLLSRTICAMADDICSMHKAAAWSGVALAILVLAEVAVSNKYLEQVVKEEDTTQQRLPPAGYF
ncbi:hypothetical protein EDD11_005438 [Mortierella claussenii]|nr:hypothetical protein EDD11_005438 [Mortierella claussenii]